jgi:CheY-like chemotaxis protein
MSGKRALVVDDSRSARAFLTRLLEEHQLEVDAAETAEQAIDYLTRHRPDVIFMDHLMPGMDGFQAVQAIKSNPRTATIPILMYTSQEGELYLGQARALGAIGVLPKQIERADMSKVLEQLHLGAGIRVPGAAAPEEPGQVDIDVNLEDVAAAAEAVATTHAANATTLAASLEGLPERRAITITQDTLTGLRADFERGLDERLERLLPQIRSMVRDAIPLPPAPVETPPPPRNPAPWLIAVLGLGTAMVFALLWMQQRQELAFLGEQLQQLRTAPAARSSAAPGAASDAAQAGVAADDSLAADGAGPAQRVLAVPFGETPLDGARTEQLRQLVNQLAVSGFTGTVEVAHHEGRFCVMAGAGGGFTLAPAALPYLQCDVVADAGDAAIGGGAPESLAFANTMAELRKAHAGRIRIEVTDGPASARDRPYPQVGGTPPRVPTAGEWNDAALANNRVEFRWRADP